MTQEEKELLLRDLCSRLPYGVKIELTWWVMDEGTCINTTLEPDHVEQLLNDEYGDTEIKPYLRPMSSMTEEEKAQLSQYACIGEDLNGEFVDEVQRKDCAAYIDWLNKYHFDYRELIERGLAIEVTEENNPYKTELL